MKRRHFLQTVLGGALAARGLRAQDAGQEEPALPATGGARRAEQTIEQLFSGAPEPDDPLELLYSRRLSFDEGQPLITVRVAEGRQSIALVPRGPLTALARTVSGQTKTAVERGAPGRWTLHLLDATPGVGASWVELEQLRFEDKQAVQRAREEWTAKGVPVRVATVGEAYGIAGHVVDTRRYAILAEGDATEEGARRQAHELEAKLGIRLQIHRELAARPKGHIELRDPSGASAAVGHTSLELRAEPGIAVEQVEHGKAHLEALKAQAVTARGEVLAKIGARHLGDPYLLCAEQHCQVYKGIALEEPGTDKAVDATRGEALFAVSGGESRLVDSVYSAVCGGFTENNDAVWGGPPDPSLRGRPDFDVRSKQMRIFLDGIGEALVARFVRLNPVPSYCALSGMARPDKVRWRRAFPQREVDEICAPLGVGPVRKLAVEGRGVSGRARALRIEGRQATARVYGELPIRRLFKNLNSGMFVVEKAGGEWVFTGGGWGHGSGMCQTGAIGRAERGASYREILGWYYSGAAPVRIF